MRRLRLSAPAEDFFGRGTILLEDALRTASLPEGAGRLLLVRSLNVGKIRASRGPSPVALAIERALCVLGAQAVHAAEPAACEHGAVYFRDDAEPYVSLALKLALREKTDAWFWPLAVRAWKPEMPRDEALRALLLAVARTEAGACAASAMIQELHRRRVSDQLLSALRREDGAALLQEFGWSGLSPVRPRVVDDSSREGGRERPGAECPAQWGGAFARWANYWGADDPRSLWLAAVVLVTEKPARLLGQSLVERARQLILAASRPPSPRVLQASKPETDEAEGAPAAAQRKQFERAGEAAEKNSRRTKRGEMKEVTPPTRRARPADSTRAENPSRSSELNAVSPRAKEQEESGGREPRERLSRDGERKPVEDESSRVPHITVAPAVTDDYTSDAPARMEEASGRIEVSRGDERERRALWRYEWADRPQPSAYAGLFFLVPLMSRLGIRAMLEDNPCLIEIDLPQRLLHFVARRLSVPDDDPALSFLSAESPEQEPYANCYYTVPPGWTHGLCDKGPWTIRRLTGERGARLLCDGSGRLALASWHGRMTPAARALVGGQALRRGSPVHTETGLSLLCQTWLTVMRRWCRRYARVGLRSLVCRPGRVAVTPTHVDILFDHEQADVRVRKAGLDINPGWVAWLGRVVTYHYLYGEQLYGK
ncbi:MAG TPA: hypothetical protein VN256_03495 [Pyrinomonadaceae bacterium]|nr:hypothetical protein [Pyrinomonadaceae bacterium]